MVTKNQWAHWDNWQMALNAQALIDLFPVGFHPRGTVAWWPFFSIWMAWPGYFLEMLVSFFPGRYTTGLRWGPCWLIYGLKRNEQTRLTNR